MLELALSIIVLLWFLNRSSLLKGLKDHIQMWSSASVLSSSLEYSKDLNKALKKASDKERDLAKSLIEGDLDYTKVLSKKEEVSNPKKDTKSEIESMLDDII